jgi:hypothetical protein
MKTYPPAPRAHKEAFVMHVPVISTAHLLQKDADQLWEDDAVLAREHTSNHTFVIIHLTELWEASSYSPEFLHLLRYFQDKGYHYLRLDPELGDEVDDLPKFEW